MVHRPLGFHKNARPAAHAMQAAHRQGKAWEMHDKMFENIKALTRPDLERYAGDVGLDVQKFKADMDSDAVKKEVVADEKVADKVGARGTPTFFINGRPISGAQPYSAFETIIKEELEKAKKLIAAGTPIKDVYATLAKNQKK
jgi:predicted DsbA family dithiol-disulfide isomerase